MCIASRVKRRPTYCSGNKRIASGSESALFLDGYSFIDNFRASSGSFALGIRTLYHFFPSHQARSNITPLAYGPPPVHSTISLSSAVSRRSRERPVVASSGVDEKNGTSLSFSEKAACLSPGWRQQHARTGPIIRAVAEL